MTTSTYLDSILRILPAVQVRNITDLLSDFQVKGEIRNADEYRAKLQELSTIVNDREPKPSFKQIRALVWYLISSDGHNLMMRSIQNDLDAIFQQINQVGEKVNDHHFLIMKNLSADMERGLADQENTIRRLEWLANQANEFSLALVNAFVSSSLYKVPRSQLGSKNLYFDNRTYKSRTEAELPSAVISEHGQKLLLDVTNEPKVLPISVTMHTDSDSYGTQIQTSVDNDILNLTDGTRGTFWTRDVYLAEPVDKVTTVLEFKLGVAKDINYMIIEGATELVFKIDSVYGIAPDGHRTTLLSTATEINGRERIDFERTLLKSVYVTFSTNSYIKTDYKTNPQSSVFDYFNSDLQFDEVALVQALSPLTAEVLTSDSLTDLLNVSTGDKESINSYVYPFALDNIWFGNSLYEDSGIFVSKPLKGNNFGVCAIQTQETTTTVESISNSIEYEIIKKDLTPQYREKKFPIPYLGQTTVTSERLILTRRELNPSTLALSTIANAGSLRFCPYVSSTYDPTTASTHPVNIYKNGELLVVNTDYQIAIQLDATSTELQWVSSFNSAVSDATDFENYLLNPAKMWIKIINPDSAAVYTVDYTLRTSDTYVDDSTIWLDIDKTIFLSDEGKVYFRQEDPDIIVESELYLQITLRRNTASQSSTPELNEYALLAAVYNN